MNTLDRPRPLVVAILDGWGINLAVEGNAIAAAQTPAIDALTAHYPMAAIAAAGLEVGLPPGLVGNSETGHRNIGAGRVEYQILASIDHAIDSGTFFQNQVLNEAVLHAVNNNSQLHLMGLLSDAGVHAHINHLYALLQLLAEQNFRERVYIHIFTDGRDTPSQSAAGYLKILEDALGKYGLGRVASVTGRFYAMDRNENWERTEATYNMLIGGERPTGASSAEWAIKRAYGQNLSDERIPPTVLTRGGSPVASIAENDAVIFFNFRPDRARQLAQAFVHPDQVGFTATPIANLYFATMSRYGPALDAHVAFLDDKAEFPMARVVADAGLTQLHVAETEKYAHVTYYLNVGHEEPFPGEDRVLVRSSGARNFADEPAMEAGQLTDRMLADIEKGSHDVYFVNFANADMVGHTGDFRAAVQACEAVDRNVGRLMEAVLRSDGALIVTADHGNAELMVNPASGAAETEHTVFPVPFYYARREVKRSVARSSQEIAQVWSAPIGVLADVAPTVLDVLRLEKPQTMTGVSLLGSLQ